MLTRKIITAFALALVLVPGLYFFLKASEQQSSASSFSKEEKIIAGGPKESMEVRHLVLKGSNEEIGHALAQIAIERYQLQPQRSDDPLRTRAQRRYMAQSFPILYERMAGVARAFGHRPDDDAWSHNDLSFTDLKAGCSIFYLPPSKSAGGTGVVSRDYDYSTGTITFGPLAPGQLHPTARPYLIEIHPDRGYASLAMTAYDLLSGTIDGMNSEGLTVTMALDDEIFSKAGLDPVGKSAVGLGVLQVQRLLLDTCATVEEAKEALLLNKQYYEFVPVHYLIADRYGNAFVWEYTLAHNKELIIESPNKPLIMTNFSLNQHMDGNLPPTADLARGVCKRYCLLTEQLQAASGPMTVDQIKNVHKKVDAELPAAATPNRPPVRTFWHALYFPEQRSMQIGFYLHDEPIAGQPNRMRIVRSDYQEFRLEPTNNGKPPAASSTLRPAPTPTASKPSATLPMDATQTAAIARLKENGAVVTLEGGKATTLEMSRTRELSLQLPLLRQLPDLTSLTIVSKKFGDKEMSALAGLPRLSRLVLSNSAVGDEGMKIVKTLPSLKSLYVKSTGVTDAGLVHVAEARQLEVLILTGDNITDAGLAHLEKLTGMTGLFLGGTKVTDAGLDNLKGMHRLTKLNLVGTRVTNEGLKKIKPSLPSWIMIEK